MQNSPPVISGYLPLFYYPVPILMTIAVVDFLHSIDVDVDNAQRTQGSGEKVCPAFLCSCSGFAGR